jgi:hypothetical protein
MPSPIFDTKRWDRKTPDAALDKATGLRRRRRNHCTIASVSSLVARPAHAAPRIDGGVGTSAHT